ncbi:hypothetical protein ATI61_107355 [Archangium gephyra]|uniref:CglB n=1 Tax=Archangium gephyra TaxID=48 RepID=A0AAC8QIW6_9BACT|nr:adventurous gliding motility lipoprotein CglB [Archangium gephyra]AKJ07911.1 CglB [Archangium gephyra]REG29659.1 hypothetical protein ATI61_107355 [Archangium gephyra]
MNAKNVSRLGGSLVRGFVLCLLGGVLATGCRPSETPEDKPDAGLPGADAGTTDAGTTDAGTSGPDAGTDAGMTDPDAGMTDPDAGTVLAQVDVGEPKPNLMLLVDTSGSMTLPMNVDLRDSSGAYVCRRGGTAAGEPCGNDTFPCDTSRCPTRWSSLQAAMASFLGSSGARVRTGLATFPDLRSDNVYNCGGTFGVTVGLPGTDTDDKDTLVAKAAQVNSELQAIKNSSSTPGVKTPMGGTPTNPSLQFMGTLPELQTAGRSNFVLLLTDGLPNCNANYPNPYPSASCRCTLGTLSGIALCSYEPYDKLGCLDKDGSVSAVMALKSKNIQTIVVGFGSELATGEGAVVLNAMAEQGGFSRTCTQHVDCGSVDTCDMSNGLCGRRFYPASNQGELSVVLQGVVDRVRKTACLVPFEGAGSYTQSSLVVSVDGVELAPGESTWSLTSEGVRFAGTTCQQLQEASRADPVRIVVRLR